MNWLSDNWKLLFEGVGGTALVAFFGYLLKRWFEQRQQPSGQEATQTAQGAAKIEKSPVASGSGITQTINETHHHHYGEAAALQMPEPAPEPEPPRPNLQVVEGNRIFIHEGLDNVFYQSDLDQGYVALVVNVTNDAQQGMANIGAIVKATLIYRDGQQQFLRITGTWLGQPADVVRFRVDDSHNVIVAVGCNGQFSVPSKRRVNHGIGHIAFPTDVNPFNAQRATVTVRLTNADTGYFYCESQFEVGLDPLRISPAKAA